MARTTPQERDAANRWNHKLSLLAKMMGDPLGREFFYDLLAQCHVYHVTAYTNAMAMAFSEGERNVGVKLGSYLNQASPELVFQMLKESGNVRYPANGADPGRDGAAAGNGADPDPDGDYGSDAAL